MATAASDSEADETAGEPPTGKEMETRATGTHTVPGEPQHLPAQSTTMGRQQPHRVPRVPHHEPNSGFFIKSIKAWWRELETQSQGVGQNTDAAWCRLLILESKAKERLSTMYNIQAEYLVEVFKYPRNGNWIPPNAPDGYGSTQMIGLYGLVDPYSITWITTTRSGLMMEDGEKKSTSKCYCSLCDYVVQNHPSVNNHFWTHLRLLLLCTINGCFHIEHACNSMWAHITKEHNIPFTHAVVPPSRRSKKKK